MPDLAGQARLVAGVVAIRMASDDLPIQAHLVLAEAARRGGRRRADPDARRDIRRQRIERDRVLVDGDADLVEQRLGFAPVTPSGVTSTSIRWLSVPPETSRQPLSASVVAARRSRSCARWSSRNSGPAASFSPTALAAITCISGPPWAPGKTVLSTGPPSPEWPSTAREVAATEDQAAARAAQGLVRGRGDDVGVRERARVGPPRPGRRCAPCRRTAALPTAWAIPPSARSR